MIRIIFMTMMLLFASTAIAIEKPTGHEHELPPIKIASLKQFAPFSFIDKQGLSQGFLIDYWRLWAKKINRRIEFVPLSLAESKLALQQKTVQMHIGFLKSTTSYDFIDFIDPIYPTKSHVVVRADNLSQLINMKDLNGKVVGVIGGIYLRQYIKTHYPLIKLKNYRSTVALITALDNGNIDAFANESILTWFEMVKTMNFHQYKKMEGFELIANVFAVAIKGEPELQALIKLGMSRISVNELTEIENRWIINEELRASSLTKKEQRWLREHPNIEIAAAFNWPPFIYINANGNEVGYSVDLISLINTNIGTDFKIKRYRDWQDSLGDVKSGKIGGILSLSWSEERAKYLNYSPTYFFDLHKIIVADDNNTINNYADLNGQRIAVVEEYMLTTLLKGKLKNSTFLPVKDTLAAYRSIENNQADVALFSHPIPELLTRYHLKAAGDFYSKAGEYSIGSSKNQPILSAILAKGINSITPQQTTRLLKDWFHQSKSHSTIFNAAELQYIKDHPVITTGAESWKPFIFNDGLEVSGIVGDFLYQISKISGLEFKPVAKPWLDLKADFKAGKVDLLPASSYTPQRAEFGLFGDGYLNVSSAIYVLSSNDKVNSFANLNGLKLAITAGDASINFVKNKYPNINIVTAIDVHSSLELLFNGEVDAVFEIEPVMLSALKNALDGRIKEIKQHQKFDRKLYFWSSKKQPLLHSILKKSMNSLSESVKSNIIQNWIGDAAPKKSIKVAFGLGREPYTLGKSHLKGIEYDMLKRIFDAKSIDISLTKNLPVVKLNNALNEFAELDVVVTVKEGQDSYYYSDEFIRFNNIIVSLKKNKFEFNSLIDLQNKKVVAFSGALDELGSHYRKIFRISKRKGLYQEVTYQQQQLDALIMGKVDAIIIDKTILSWLLSQLGYRVMDTFQLDDLLNRKTNSYRVAFRHRKLRDIFNDGLKDLKLSGEYQHIINGYALGLVMPKVELSSMISLLVAPYILSEDTDNIHLIVNQFVELPYIDNIEIFTDDGVLLYQNTTDKFVFYQQFDSFSSLNNLTKQVGFIRVFFNEIAVKNQLTKADLIPDIDDFKKYRYFEDVKAVYLRFGYLDKKINFSLAEKIYLSRQPTLTYSETDWHPLSIIENNHFSGLSADYMHIVAKKTGIKFKFKPIKTWLEVVSAFKAKDIDFLPGVADIDNYKAMGLLSDQFAYFKFAIVMSSQSNFISESNDLKGKVIALPKGNGAYFQTKQQYPNATFIEVDTNEQALHMVRDGRADVFVEHLAVVVYQLENEFSDLRMVGLLSSGYSHRMMVQQDQQILLSIINKVIASISLAKHQEINDRWVRTEIKTAVDYRLLYQLLAGFFLILMIILFVVKKIANAKKEVERAHLKLERSFSNLQQTQQHLVESEKMASLGGLVAGIAHEINTPVGIGLTAITHFLSMTESLEKKYNDQKMSQSEFERYLKSSIESAQIINRNLEKTAQLVSSFKQISVDQSSDERRFFKVKKYIEEIQLSIFHLTKKTNITIEVDCDDELMIDSYPGALSQILSNFMINSTIHAYPNNEHGIILIKVEQINGEIKLIYTDDGAGIPALNIKKIFNPFFTTNREKGGSGLGLNIIYNIVINRLKGKIECRSELGEFTEFTIIFTPTSIRG